jgi:hypothetical protein
VGEGERLADQGPIKARDPRSQVLRQHASGEHVAAEASARSQEVRVPESAHSQGNQAIASSVRASSNTSRDSE